MLDTYCVIFALCCDWLLDYFDNFAVMGQNESQQKTALLQAVTNHSFSKKYLVFPSLQVIPQAVLREYQCLTL